MSLTSNYQEWLDDQEAKAPPLTPNADKLDLDDGRDDYEDDEDEEDDANEKKRRDNRGTNSERVDESLALSYSEKSSAKFTAHGMLAIESKACDVEWLFEESHQQEPQVTEAAAIVTVRGPLNHHPDVRFDSYDKILPRIEAAFASSAPGVLLSADSPGGEVSGCFDTAEAIRALRVKYNKPLIGYVDGQSSSAMYALICACDTVVIPKEGVAGSIGVFSEVKSKARLNRAMGLDVEMVASGLRKLDGNPNVEITDEALANIQVGVMQQANVFWSWVSERRGIALDAVKAFEGRSYHGAQAVQMGLADVVGTYSDALAMVAGASVANAAQSGGENKGAEMSALRKMLLDEAAGEDENAKKAKRALEAYDATEEEQPPEKKDEPKHDEPDGDEGRRAEDEDEEEEARRAEEVEMKRRGESRKATRAEDDEAKRAESEEDEAKRCEDDAKKAEDDAGDEDAKARDYMRSKAYDKAEQHLANASKLRTRASGLHSRASRCLKDAQIFRALAKSNALALDTQKKLARSGSGARIVASASNPSTRGAGQGEPRQSADDVLPPEYVKAAGFSRKQTDTMEYEGETHLALVSPSKAKQIYDETQAKIAKLGGRS